MGTAAAFHAKRNVANTTRAFILAETSRNDWRKLHVLGLAVGMSRIAERVLQVRSRARIMAEYRGTREHQSESSANAEVAQTVGSELEALERWC